MTLEIKCPYSLISKDKKAIIKIMQTMSCPSMPIAILMTGNGEID